MSKGGRHKSAGLPNIKEGEVSSRCFSKLQCFSELHLFLSTALLKFDVSRSQSLTNIKDFCRASGAWRKKKTSCRDLSVRNRRGSEKHAVIVSPFLAQCDADHTLQALLTPSSPLVTSRSGRASASPSSSVLAFEMDSDTQSNNGYKNGRRTDEIELLVSSGAHHRDGSLSQNGSAPARSGAHGIHGPGDASKCGAHVHSLRCSLTSHTCERTLL